ncbi:MAG: hypothetical protein SP1CHLAM54_11710 [Chlamydiia bacterium]|nr:hypothetical protein [Chlamydiia bacterium]MCH9616074.1 hypothetical protein [Chlamydiia bacterium]MCH9629097.1 hypothetical protein [Chlamydiia bacterium]
MAVTRSTSSDISFTQFSTIMLPELIKDEHSPFFENYPPEVRVRLKAMHVAERALSPSSTPLSPTVRATHLATIAAAKAVLIPERAALIEACYLMYQKVLKASTGMVVLGSGNIRTDPDLLHAFGKLTHESPSAEGAILSTNVWSLTLNDSLILSAYLNGMDCCVSLPTGFPTSKDVRNKPGPKSMLTPTSKRVLCRELEMLFALGFTQRNSPEDVKKYGMMFRVPDHLRLELRRLTSDERAARARVAIQTMREAAANTTSIKALAERFGGWGSAATTPATGVSPATARPSISTPSAPPLPPITGSPRASGLRSAISGAPSPLSPPPPPGRPFSPGTPRRSPFTYPTGTSRK